jgi:hypothetical protein
MTGSCAPWPTWVSSSRIRRWATFSAAMIVAHAHLSNTN